MHLALASRNRFRGSGAGGGCKKSPVHNTVQNKTQGNPSCSLGLPERKFSSLGAFY